MFSFVYFFSLIGPLPAIVFPRDTRFFDTYHFWQGIITHHILVILAFYALFICDYKVEKNDYKIAAILGNLIFFTMIVFNSVFNTNYIFSKDLPDVVLQSLPFISFFYHPIFWLEFTGIVLMFLAYYPVRAVQNKKIV